MATVQIKINPSIASMASKRWETGWLTLDFQIDGNDTIGKMLGYLIRERPGLARIIFDMQSGLISDEINVVHNENLLISSKAADVKIKDGDKILLLPIYTGG